MFIRIGTREGKWNLSIEELDWRLKIVSQVCKVKDTRGRHSGE